MGSRSGGGGGGGRGGGGGSSSKGSSSGTASLAEFNKSVESATAAYHAAAEAGNRAERTKWFRAMNELKAARSKFILG